MVKMHKLTKGGQTIFPATIYDAVVNPNTRKSLTTELSELENEEIYLKTQIEGLSLIHISMCIRDRALIQQ